MTEDFSKMDDMAFLALRKSVREQVEELQESYERINEEFDRRARAAWVNPIIPARHLRAFMREEQAS